MAIYQYLCRNEECPSVVEDRPRFEERFCSSSERNNLPICEECGQEMPRAYLEMPSVSWRYLSANGVMTNSFMGPCQRADRRHAGWDNGVPQNQPVYKEGKSNVRKRELQVTPQGSFTRVEGGDN